MGDIFISHNARSMGVAALRLYLHLKKYQLAASIDFGGAEENADKQFLNTAQQCRVMIILLDRGWAGNRRCLAEFSAAAGAFKRSGGKLPLVIPVVIGGHHWLVPDKFSEAHRVIAMFKPFTKGPEESWDKLFQRLISRLETGASMRIVKNKAEPSLEFRALNDVLICLLCNMNYEQPILASCNHAFCRECLENLWGPGSKPDTLLRCPLCDIGLDFSRELMTHWTADRLLELFLDEIAESENKQLFSSPVTELDIFGHRIEKKITLDLESWGAWHDLPKRLISELGSSNYSSVQEIIQLSSSQINGLEISGDNRRRLKRAVVDSRKKLEVDWATEQLTQLTFLLSLYDERVLFSSTSLPDHLELWHGLGLRNRRNDLILMLERLASQIEHFPGDMDAGLRAELLKRSSVVLLGAGQYKDAELYARLSAMYEHSGNRKTGKTSRNRLSLIRFIRILASHLKLTHRFVYTGSCNPVECEQLVKSCAKLVTMATQAGSFKDEYLLNYQSLPDELIIRTYIIYVYTCGKLMKINETVDDEESRMWADLGSRVAQECYPYLDYVETESRFGLEVDLMLAEALLVLSPSRDTFTEDELKRKSDPSSKAAAAAGPRYSLPGAPLVYPEPKAAPPTPEPNWRSGTPGHNRSSGPQRTGSGIVGKDRTSKVSTKSSTGSLALSMKAGSSFKNSNVVPRTVMRVEHSPSVSGAKLKPKLESHSETISGWGDWDVGGTVDQVMEMGDGLQAFHQDVAVFHAQKGKKKKKKKDGGSQDESEKSGSSSKSDKPKKSRGYTKETTSFTEYHHSTFHQETLAIDASSGQPHLKTNTHEEKENMIHSSRSVEIHSGSQTSDDSLAKNGKQAYLESKQGALEDSKQDDDGENREDAEVDGMGEPKRNEDEPGAASGFETGEEHEQDGEEMSEKAEVADEDNKPEHDELPGEDRMAERYELEDDDKIQEQEPLVGVDQDVEADDYQHDVLEDGEEDKDAAPGPLDVIDPQGELSGEELEREAEVPAHVEECVDEHGQEGDSVRDLPNVAIAGDEMQIAAFSEQHEYREDAKLEWQVEEHEEPENSLVEDEDGAGVEEDDEQEPEEHDQQQEKDGLNDERDVNVFEFTAEDDENEPELPTTIADLPEDTEYNQDTELGANGSSLDGETPHTLLLAKEQSGSAEPKISVNSETVSQSIGEEQRDKPEDGSFFDQSRREGSWEPPRTPAGQDDDPLKSNMTHYIGSEAIINSVGNSSSVQSGTNSKHQKSDGDSSSKKSSSKKSQSQGQHKKISDLAEDQDVIEDHDGKEGSRKSSSKKSQPQGPEESKIVTDLPQEQSNTGDHHDSEEYHRDSVDVRPRNSNIRGTEGEVDPKILPVGEIENFERKRSTLDVSGRVSGRRSDDWDWKKFSMSTIRTANPEVQRRSNVRDALSRSTIRTAAAAAVDGKKRSTQSSVGSTIATRPSLRKSKPAATHDLSTVNESDQRYSGSSLSSDHVKKKSTQLRPPKRPSAASNTTPPDQVMASVSGQQVEGKDCNSPDHEGALLAEPRYNRDDAEDAVGGYVLYEGSFYDQYTQYVNFNPAPPRCSLLSAEPPSSRPLPQDDRLLRLVEAWKASVHVFGEFSSLTGTCYCFIAKVLDELEMDRESYECFRRFCLINLRLFGDFHHNTKLAYHNTAAKFLPYLAEDGPEPNDRDLDFKQRVRFLYDLV